MSIPVSSIVHFWRTNSPPGVGGRIPLGLNLMAGGLTPDGGKAEHGFNSIPLHSTSSNKTLSNLPMETRLDVTKKKKN